MGRVIGRAFVDLFRRSVLSDIKGTSLLCSRDFTGYFAHESLPLWNRNSLLGWRMFKHAYLPVGLTFFVPIKFLDTRRGTKCNHSQARYLTFDPWILTQFKPREKQSTILAHANEYLCLAMSLYSLISNFHPGTNHVPRTRMDMEHFYLTFLPGGKPHRPFRRLPGERDAVCLNWDMAWSLKDEESALSPTSLRISPSLGLDSSSYLLSSTFYKTPTCYDLGPPWNLHIVSLPLVQRRIGYLHGLFVIDHISGLRIRTQQNGDSW